MSRLLRLTSTYKSNVFTATFASLGIGTGIFTFFSNSYCMDRYAALFQMYKKGFEVEVSQDLVNMLSEVSDNLGIPVLKPPTKLFHIIGYDSTHFGAIFSEYGCMIGLPISFQHKSVSDVEKESILIEKKPVAWYSEDGAKLLDSLVMSDSAKKFGIAYELALANTFQLAFHSFCGPASTMVCVIVNNYFCTAFGLPFKALPVKGAFYLTLLVFGIGVYFLLKDVTSNVFESAALEKLAEAGQEYVSGGIEFYDKLLAKNKALRHFLKNGTSYFNSNGDAISLFRKKHIPITAKKQFLESRLIVTENF